ncbi:MAG: hypothetical protein K2N88_09320 [Muribaculaceae bacterium]|nr:hypothetical protein [Muribaculaceae bacterium]
MKIFRPLLLGLSSLFAFSVMKAELINYYPFNHEQYMLAHNWPRNNDPYVTMTSTQMLGGTYWESYGFSHPYSNYGAYTGFTEPQVTTIRSVMPLDYNYYKLAVQFSINHYSIELLDEDITFDLMVSSNPIFSDDAGYAEPAGGSDEIIIAGRKSHSIGGSIYVLFTLPERTTEDYMKLRVHAPARSVDSWMELSQMSFLADRGAVSMREYTATKTCEIVANRGELHVKAHECDALGNIVNPDVVVKASATRYMTMDESNDEEEWSNKVGEQDEVFLVHAPTAQNHYVEISAKSYHDGEYSKPLLARMLPNGIVTEIPELNDENTETTLSEEWYDLMGTKVDQPTQGIYVCKKGNKVTKHIF